MKSTLILLTILLMSTHALADTITHITVGVEESGKVTFKKTIELAKPGETLEQQIPPDAEDVQTYSNQGIIPYTITAGEETTILQTKPPENTPTLTLDYTTQQYTSKTNGLWTLGFTTPSTEARTIIKINFPANSTILNWTPHRFSVGPDTLYIYPDVNETNFTATYQFKGEGETIPPTPQDNRVYYLAAAVILLLAVIAALLLLRRRKAKAVTGIQIADIKIRQGAQESIVEVTEEELVAPEEKKTKPLKDSVMKMLEENEKKVVDILRAHDEEITQAQIYHTTGIPKASLSDIMNRLERRNIVERTREGRVKWVKLKKWVYQ